MEISTGDGALHAVAFGAGSRNFLGHGAGPAGWELWLSPLERLSASGWRAASFDHRGSGSSVFPDDKITARALVDDVFRVMDALKFDRCVLGGESMGSVVAMLAAQRHPERFDGILLCCPPPLVSEGARRLWDGWENDLEGFSRGFIDLGMPEPDAQHLKTWTLDIFTKGSARRGHKAMKCLFEAGADAIPKLDQIKVPTVVVVGEADVITSPSVNQIVAEGIANATTVTIPGMGHFPTITRPDKVVEAILNHF